MPGPSATPIIVAEHVRPKLKRLATSRTAPHDLVVRARIIEFAAYGLDNTEIARRLGVTVRRVRRWRNRFAENPRLESLNDRKRSGRPPQVPLEVRARLLSLACERAEEDKTPFRVLWSHAALRDALERDTGVRISVSEVGRILRNGAIRPHRVRMWLNSQDPQFAEKSREVCRHYVAPAPGTTVLCIDEKRLFAHEHLPGGVKPPNARHSGCRREYQWKRNGSGVLLAAFDVGTGRVYGECRDRRTADDLVEFMEEVAKRTPGKVVVIWDNLNIHHEGKDQRWNAFNARHKGRFTFVYTPKHASWLNQVECWFSILERRILRHASFPDVPSVYARTRGFIDHWNAHEAHPFNWTFRGTFSPGMEAPRGRIHSGRHRSRLAA